MNKTTRNEVILSLLCTAFVFILQFYNIPLLSIYINEMDYQIYDEIVTLNLNTHQHNPKVVIIDIDDNSIQKEGRWPWPRDKMAKLITLLKQSGIVTIGMDIVMPDAEINYAEGLKKKLLAMTPNPAIDLQNLITSLNAIALQTDNDQIFAKTLLDHNIILGYLFDNQNIESKGSIPQPLQYTLNTSIKLASLLIYTFQSYIGTLDLFLQASTKGGFVTNFPDSDGAVRRTVLLGRYKDNIYSSLALSTAMNYLLVDSAALVTQDKALYGIQLQGSYIPTNSHGQSLIPFWGPPGTLDYYSATDILGGKVDPKLLQGAIAIVGSTFTLLADLHTSPVAGAFPGVEMVGNIVQAIVSQEIPREYDWHTFKGRLFFLFAGILFSLVLSFLNIVIKLILSCATLASILVGAFYLFRFENLYVPSAFLLVLIAFLALFQFAYSFIIERLQKRKISQLFGQYVPEDYVKELIEFPDKYSMEGQTRNMTVLFADIRNFTNTSETLDASSVKNLLNTFFTPITEIIFRHRGTIDKYVGDMVVAFWGAPLEDQDHAYHAILASLEIFVKLPEINERMIANNLPSVNIGVGLSTGLMNVGDMGSEFRRAYTVLGDTVNLASRLQDLTKFYHVNILVNDATRLGQDLILWQAVDKVAVKGRKTALTIYQPLGLVSDASPEFLVELEEYSKALEQYYTQNWNLAEEAFATLKQNHPDTYLYQLYLHRIEEFKTNPPVEDWDGVFVHSHK
ncbi:MAG: CHASE2 domain-containing protein [Gammaproteobacteria bacterium]